MVHGGFHVGSAIALQGEGVASHVLTNAIYLITMARWKPDARPGLAGPEPCECMEPSKEGLH